jgi:hypothetical protein
LKIESNRNQFDLTALPGRAKYFNSFPSFQGDDGGDQEDMNGFPQEDQIEAPPPADEEEQGVGRRGVSSNRGYRRRQQPSTSNWRYQRPRQPAAYADENDAEEDDTTSKWQQKQSYGRGGGRSAGKRRRAGRYQKRREEQAQDTDADVQDDGEQVDDVE